MTIINTRPDRIIQLGYEGEDRVTVLRFRYSADWLENGEGIFHIRVRRHGEHTAYNAQLVADDTENNCLLMTVTSTELSVKGYGKMQVVYIGEDFVKKSPIYSYNVSRSVDEAVDPPAQDVYTEIIESLSDLQTGVRQISSDVADLSELTAEKIGDMTALTTEAKSSLVSAINEVNSKSVDITVDSALSDTSENPVQNKTITGAIREVSSYARDLSGVIDGLGEDVEGLETALRTKADTATVSALSDAVNDLDSDVQGLQTTVQSKADTATVTELSGTVSNLLDSAQQYMEYTNSEITNLWDSKASKASVDGKLALKADTQTVTALSGTVTGLQTSKADKSYVDTQLSEKASTQTVSDLSDDVSDLQTGLAGKVGDVQVNGTSVVSNGVANVPKATAYNYGTVKFNGDYGITGDASWETPRINTANTSGIKNGVTQYRPITPSNQHESAFYGLSKAAGHDEKDSNLPVGTYSEEAKVAIQKMLGIYEAPWELINEETFTNETEADYIITTDANGNPFELTDLIILFETPKQATYSAKGYSGHIWFYYGTGSAQYVSFECGSWTQEADAAYHTCGGIIENKGGLMESTIIATTTSGLKSTMCKRLISGFSSNTAMSFIPSSLTFTKINIRAVTGTGHYRLYGKRKWT